MSRTAGSRRRFFPFQRPSCGRPHAGCRFDIPTLLPMRTFACQQFGHRVAFEADRCMDCATALGFLPEDRVVAVVDPAEGALMAARAEPEGGRCWQCLNAAWGFNQLVPEAGPGPWCASCRLTRGRPDTADSHDSSSIN